MTGVKFIKSELYNCSFVRADLRWSELMGGRFVSCNLKYANLCKSRGFASIKDPLLAERDEEQKGVVFEWCDMREVKALGADLPGSRFVKCDLRGSLLMEANLQGADLTGIDLSESNLRGANLRDAVLIGAKVEKSNLVDADLSSSKMDEKQDWTNCVFNVGTKFPSQFDRAYWFVRMIVSRDAGAVDLSGLDWKMRVWSGKQLIGARMSSSQFPNCKFIDCNLSGADLRDSNLS